MKWEKTKTALHGDIFMGGSYASTVRQTKQNAAALGESLVALEPPWGPPIALGVQYALARLR